MGVYNNDNGNINTIATNIRTQSTTFENFVTQEELVEGLETKQDVIQYETLPTASADNLGQIVQYIGETGVYINGYFYKCVSDENVDPTYSWEQISVQDSGGSDDYTDLVNKPQIESVTLSGNKTASDLGLQVEMQLSTVPTASVDYLNKIIQYTGTTNSTYTNGYFYKCVSDGATPAVYSWVRVDIQPSLLHFSTMPSTEELFALPDNTIFETDGFYTQTDGNGGKYIISNNQWTSGALQITFNNVTKALIALHSDGTINSKEVDVCRYGIRNSNTVSDITLENTYAEQNSDIISRIYQLNLRGTLKFPVGRFYFKNPIDVRSRQYNIVGTNTPHEPNIVYDSNYSDGTILCFPFLSNGQTAIKLTLSNIENVTIAGNPTVYNFNIDRSKTITAPNEVVTETIAEDDQGTQIKCKALETTGNCKIINVNIVCFYEGIISDYGNTIINNIILQRCHTGLLVHSDNKCRDIFGWYVNTLMEMDGTIISVNSIRADSCVHLIRIKNSAGSTITDADGDYCTDSLIVIGNETDQYLKVNNCSLENIHGRCCTLKSYDSSQSSTPDVRDLSNTSGYGIIRVEGSTQFRDNRIVISKIGNDNPFDNDSGNYRTPSIIFTFSNTATYLIRNQFICNSISGLVLNTDNIPKLFQAKTGFNSRIDSSEGVFYLRDTYIDKDTTQVSSLPTASATELGNIYLYTGASDQSIELIHGCSYECISDGASTPTYSWEPVGMSIEMLKHILTESEDFDDFKTIITTWF